MAKDMRSEMLTAVQALSAEEKKRFVEQILAMMSENGDAPADVCKNEFDELAQDVHGTIPSCPHCGKSPVDNAIIKKGRNRNGAQRFYCKACGKFFVAATGTTFAHTRKPLSVWRKFIELTISGCSISICEAECDIAHQTAFIWRHKILNVFKVAQEKITMTGWVEADEMLVPLSYKGNHIHGKVGERRVRSVGADMPMPRKAMRRGSDNKSNSSKTKACVFCMVENADQTFYGVVPGIGFMNADTLDATLGQCVDRSSAMMLVDRYKITRTYYKYSDEKHRLNSTRLNKILAPYGLECDKGVIRDTVKRLREFGVNVGYKGFWGTAGFWIADRPLSDEKLKELIFAVRSNPNLSSVQADNILASLKPLVTIYQEELLVCPQCENAVL